MDATLANADPISDQNVFPESHAINTELPEASSEFQLVNYHIWDSPAPLWVYPIQQL